MRCRASGLLGLALLGFGCASGPSYLGSRQPAPPPPPEATIDGIHFRATTVVVSKSPLEFRTTVTATNAGSRARHTVLAADCVVRLRAYQGRPANSGPPAWEQKQDPACGDDAIELSFEPGQSREFFAEVSADEVLGRLLPAGRYVITAVVRTPDGEIELAAGDLMLGRSRVSAGAGWTEAP